MVNINKDFPLLQNKKIAYLDSGATTQKPIQVIDAVEHFYKFSNANPHRGAYGLSIEATELYEQARANIANFINASSKEQVIFTKNASESLNLLAYSYGLDNVNEGDEIVISIMEHHSNLVPWQKVAKTKNATLKYMYMDENYEITDKEIEEKITKTAHKHDAIVIVDGSQSIPHMKIDVQKLDCDFFVFSGHKMLAPLGVGVLYGKKNLLNTMTPFLMGGDMIEYVYEQETTFAPLPNKFEAGTQNAGGVVGLSAAIDYINELGYDKIESIEKELLEYAYEKLEKLDYLDLYIPKDKSKHQGVISFNIKNIHPHDVASVLDSENVCVRSGNHCAQPLLRFMGIDSTCRASFYFYNTKNDVDLLVKALDKTYNMFKKYINS